MTMPVMEQKQVGKLQFTIYVFKDTGDELPTHNHPVGQAHITIVNQGKIRAWGNGWEKVMEAGKIVVFAPNDPHAFTALEPNSKITNIIY